MSFTQEDVASALKIKRSDISKIEKGREISLHQFTKLCEIFGKPPGTTLDTLMETSGKDKKTILKK